MHMISKKDLSEAEMDTLRKSCSPTIVITANGEVQTQEEAIVYVKELGIFLTMKVLENTSAVLSLGKLCDENGYSYEWINGQKPHLNKNGIRIICNTENFVPIVVPGLWSSSSGSSSTSRTPMRQESHCSSSSSSSPSSPTVGDLSVREREDVTNSDISPVPVSKLVDDSSGRPDEDQANKIPKTNKKETTTTRRDRPIWSVCSATGLTCWWRGAKRRAEPFWLRISSHLCSDTCVVCFAPWGFHCVFFVDWWFVKDGPEWKCRQDLSKFCEVRAQSHSSGQSNRSWFPTGRVVSFLTRHDPDSVMSNAGSRIAKLEAAMVAFGESDPTSQILPRSAEDTLHWQRFSQFKTALQARNLSLHAPGSAWRQSAKVWRQPRRWDR